MCVCFNVCHQYGRQVEYSLHMTIIILIEIIKKEMFAFDVCLSCCIHIDKQCGPRAAGRDRTTASARYF